MMYNIYNFMEMRREDIMKNYRVDYINGKTGRRNHKDYATQRGAMKFVDYLGRDNCILKKYNESTYEFDIVWDIEDGGIRDGN